MLVRLFRSRRIFLLLALVVVTCLTPALEAQPLTEQKTFSVEDLRPFNGLRVEKIEIEGLRWTRESAARFLLSIQEGEVFDANKWIVGLHRIYDTTVLYEISTTAVLVPSHNGLPASVRLTMSVKDRWTLLPFAVAQSGGGSTSFGVGLAEFNFLGTFAQVSGSYGTFNAIDSYDLNVFQEFFRDTNLIWGFDISQVGAPVQLQKNDGSVAGTFTRLRTQAQILLGRKWTDPKTRLLTYIEAFQDKLTGTETGVQVSVFPALQYRIRPTVIFGRSELTNFLEQGVEFTLAPVFANSFDRTANYVQLVSSYKQVFLHGNTNYALYLNAGAMSQTETPDLFRLGGYDSVRGFSTNRAVGRSYATSSLEFRPYLFRLSSDLTGELVFQGCVFQDAAIMWNANQFQGVSMQAANLPLLSEGAGLRMNILRFSGAIARIDAAKAVSPDEGWDVSIGVGQFF